MKFKNPFQKEYINPVAFDVFCKEFYEQNKEEHGYVDLEDCKLHLRYAVESKILSSKMITEVYKSIAKGEKIILCGHSENPLDNPQKMFDEVKKKYERLYGAIDE